MYIYLEPSSADSLCAKRRASNCDKSQGHLAQKLRWRDQLRIYVQVACFEFHRRCCEVKRNVDLTDFP